MGNHRLTIQISVMRVRRQSESLRREGCIVIAALLMVANCLEPGFMKQSPITAHIAQDLG
jgi:hypothetical protein